MAAHASRLEWTLAALASVAVALLVLSMPAHAQGPCGDNTSSASACKLAGPNFTQRGALIAKSQSYLTHEHDYYAFRVSGPARLLITITNLTKPACSEMIVETVGYAIGCGYVRATLQNDRGGHIDSTLGSTPLNGHTVTRTMTPDVPGAGVYYVVVNGQLAQGIHGTENTLYLLKVKQIPADSWGATACVVPAPLGELLAVYELRLKLTGCSLGPVRYRDVAGTATGHVISVSPDPARKLPVDAPITVYVAKP